MSSLFANAVASIRMGVEDFQQQDHDRDISAVRNFYAGVLLLAKEERWPGKIEQCDKWIFCLTAAKGVARQETI